MPHEPFHLENELPGELIQAVFRCLDVRSLANLMKTNKRISALACAILYQSIDLDLDHVRFMSCLKALSNTERSKHVLRLRVDFERKDPDGPKTIFFDDEEGIALVRCLKSLPNLRCLTLNMSPFDTAKPLNATFPFRLIRFSTTLACDSDLLAFVERQSTLQDIRIDSTIEFSGVLDGVQLPELRVLRWGHETAPNPAAFELLKKASSVRDIYASFSEPGVMENTLSALKYWQNPARAFFTVLFNCGAMSLASSGIEGLEYLSFSESADHPGCFDDIQELRLRNYPCLKTLNFRWIEATWRNFEAGGGFHEVIRIWFSECHSLEKVTFDVVGVYGFYHEENRHRNLKMES